MQASSGQLWPVRGLALTPENTEGPVSTSLALVSTSICQVTYISDLAAVQGGRSPRKPHGGVVVAILNIRETVKITSMLSRFDGKLLKSPDRPPFFTLS